MLVAGEPGIGKSRLAEELASAAREAGARVLVGRCWEAGGAPAYWPWVQSLRDYVGEADPEDLRARLAPAPEELLPILPELRDLFPGLPEPRALDSEGARFRLFEATSAFLRRATRDEPILLVLDDVHAADEPSLLLLQFVARQIADSRLLVRLRVPRRRAHREPGAGRLDRTARARAAHHAGRARGSPPGRRGRVHRAGHG